jgi:hypothetical protein
MGDVMQRRDFIQSIGISGGLGALWPAMSGLAMEALAQPAAPARAGIEPITIKRRGVGLRDYDPDRAFPGFTLFAPLPSTNKTVYLVDMQFGAACLSLYGCGSRQGAASDLTPERRPRVTACEWRPDNRLQDHSFRRYR